jgi:2'-5' RNA ligase
MTQIIRTFIAIKLPAAVTTAVGEMQKGMRSNGIKLRWVKPENIHLTLKFLGDTNAEDLAKIEAAVFDSIKSYGPISLCARGVGVFPGIKRARVVWVGVAGELESLFGMQKRLETGLAALGFAKEQRAFKGHLTLGRVKGRIDPQKLGGALKLYGGFASEAFRVESVILYKSELKPTGAVYTELAKVPLGQEEIKLKFQAPNNR